MPSDLDRAAPAGLDPAGDLPQERLASAVETLRLGGLEVIAPDFARVPWHAREIEAESRVHAALEAALNCEVRIETGEAGQSSPARQPGRGSGSGGT